MTNIVKRDQNGNVMVALTSKIVVFSIAIAMTLISEELPIESLRHALWAIISYVNSNKKNSSWAI